LQKKINENIVNILKKRKINNYNRKRYW
jgi:hypothetical protein